MGYRRILLHKAFQRIMWTEMSEDPDWADRLDELSGKLPPGESWPKEKL
jgi:hypothetical protein